MCKHHWICEATIEGVTPARCKLCNERHVFHARGPYDAATAEERHTRQAQARKSSVSLAEVPFNPHRYEPRKGLAKLRGIRRG